jgi:hypothetical protein
MWVATATLWGAVVFVTLKSAPQCPLEETTARCDTAVASTWSINAALAVLVLMLLIEPPKIYYRMLRSAVRRFKQRGKRRVASRDREDEVVARVANQAAAHRRAKDKQRTKKRKAARQARKR